MPTAKYSFFITLFYVCWGQDDSNKLWILIDNANLLTCAGAPNQFTLTKDDVSVKDKDGNIAEWMEAPGQYFIVFNNIKVLKPLPNINGRLGSTLQVPLVTAGPIRLDFPYQVIPQKTVLEGSTCDNESGVIYDSGDKREYCRYCDLCQTSDHVEKQLGNGALGNIYTPNVGSGQEGSFSKVCQQIDGTTYSLKRTVNIPDKKELEKQATDRYKGSLEGVVQQKLKVGKGKLQVFLNLDSNSEPPVDANRWYSNNLSCSCCVKDQMGTSRCQASFMERMMGKKSSTCLKCNNEYVKTCLKGRNERVGCFVVEYNFKVTDNRTEFEAFKKTLSSSKQSKSVKTNVIEDRSSGSGQNQGQSASNGGWQPQQPSGPVICSDCDKQACVNSMNDRAKGYCNNMGQKTGPWLRYCCNQCPSVCKN